MNGIVAPTLASFILFSVIVSNIALESPKEYYYDIYTGRHFNSMVTSNIENDDVIIKPALLILYGSQCENEAMELKKELRPYAGPMDKYLTVAFYDYELFPRHIWYKLDAVDDLKQRYISTWDDCMKVLYFEEGSRVGNPEVWDSAGTVYDWIWTKFLTNVTIHNALDHKIFVRKEGQGPPFLLEQIWQGESAEIQTHIGLALTVCDIYEILLYGVWLERHHRFTQFIITEELVEEFQEHIGIEIAEDSDIWASHERYQREMESQEIENTNRGKALNYLVAFKQPLFLPSFTKEGFLKRKIPKHVYSYLKTFYDNKKALKGGLQNESMKENTVVNVDEKRPGMVELTEEVKRYVYDELSEIHEEWCNCKLEGTYFYGIREYYKGNILHMHVDRVATHVISSILQIDQDLGLQGSDWPLEVIDLNGDRHFVVLKPGEMLLYESATVFHGRPTLFRGNYFANCFLHYKPRDNWPWEIVDNDYLTNGNDIREPFPVINTPNTLRKLSLKSEL